jgi:hypothetical protein
MTESTAWKHCSTCKTDIAFGQSYYECSVSTCNRKRTALYFCSLPCWEAHLPMMRHRDAWAVEARAPEREAWAREQEAELEAGRARQARADTAPEAPERRVVGVGASPAAPSALELRDDDLPREVLVVVSKLKQYIRARSGMNTSDNVTGILSDHIRRLCDHAIRSAGQDGRKTVLDRDFPEVPRHHGRE